MKSNTEQLKIAEKYLGEKCPKCCNMSNNCCCYFVCKIFKEAGNASLFYGGTTVTYCPNAIKWCKANLAQIPIYLAMPSDVIFFDWELNGVPNHIGFVDHRISDQQVATLEGNTTSSYVVARRVREVKYIQGVFRPRFKGSYDTSKALEIDGQFGYNSIAMLQKALGIKVDAILGRDTVKALQKKAGVTQDGAWGVNTSKAVQKMVGTTADGAFGEKSVKALQAWINKQIGKTTTSTDKTASAQPQPPVVASDKLVVDGTFGKKSIMKAQKYFGTEADGIISGQLKANKSKLSGIDQDCITWGGKGSSMVRAMQKKFGLTQDGVLGTNTIKALQQFLVVTADGSWGAKTSRALQTFLNSPSTYKTGKVTVTETPSIISKELSACKTQSAWMKNADYKWESNPTIEKSKKKGTCVTYVACVLQRIGVLKSGQYIWQNGKGYGTGKVYGTNDKMTVTYMNNKTLSSLKSKLKAGDIVLVDDNKSGKAGSGGHIFILTGSWWGSAPYIWDNETAKKGQKARTYSGSRKVLAVVRLK